MTNVPNAVSTASQSEKQYVLDDKTREELIKATQHKDSQEWDKCEKKAARIVKKDPKCVLALNLLSVAQIKRKKYAAAYKTLSAIIQLEPDNKQALGNRALATYEWGADDKMEKAFEEAFAYIDNDPTLFGIYGKHLYSMGLLKEALPYFKKALDSDPNLEKCEFVLLIMAKIFHTYKEYGQAVELWISLLRQHPERDDLMVYISESLYYLGKPKEATEMAVQALMQNPDSARNQTVFVLALRGLEIKEFDEKIFQALYYCLSIGQMDFYSVFHQWQTLLLLNPEFAPLVALRSNPDEIKEKLEEPDVKENLLHPYFLLGLRYLIQANAQQEIFLITLRRILLEKQKTQDLDDSWIPLLSAFGECCFMNEYVWNISANEQKIIDDMIKDIEASDSVALESKRQVVVTLSSYIALKDLKNADTILRVFEKDDSQEVRDIVQMQIAEPKEELQLRKTIQSLSPVEDNVSQKVREQYEENPYPRWRSNFVQDQNEAADHKDIKNVLVAGCGTGRHVTIAAMNFPKAKITALDLSLSSLSYAKRKIEELGIPNITFVHGDILDVDKIGQQFDHIECSGVLHHMEDPFLGWQKLVRILRPEGTMRLGLYSELGRKDVVVMRDEIEREGFTSDLSGIRKARMHALAAPNDSILKTLWVSRDIFSTSNCRDLIMHVQEQRYTIDRLKTEIEALGLEFTGMCPVSARYLLYYAKSFPNDPQYKNLDQLKAFEETNPMTFRGMYQFDVKKQ